MSLEWLKLRSWNGSQQTAFEKLSVQLLAHESVRDGSKFVAKGSPDAGVEAFWTFPNGDEWGIQSKFFLGALTENQWAQIEESFHNAVARHPRIVKYTVCIPQDRADPRLEKQKWFMDKWNDYTTKWREYAQDHGLHLEIDYWGEAEFLDRLTRPENRGKLLFWFDQHLLTIDWLRGRVEEAVANVGPRYTPELNVKLPIATTFEALGHTPVFFDVIGGHRARVRKEHGRTQAGPARKEVACDWASLDNDTAEVVSALAAAKAGSVSTADFDRLSKLASVGEEKAWECVRTIDEFEKKRAKDSDRQVRESMFSFEGKELRDLAGELDDVVGFCKSVQATAAAGGALLLVGAAGTGKTHLFCDISLQRLRDHQPTLLLLGPHFEDKEPLTQIAGGITGLNLSRDDFLAAVDAAGEASGAKFLILIDAINEGEGQTLWAKYMPGVLKVLAGYPHVAIAFSVRDTYEDLVVPAGLADQMAREVHVGFAGHEYSATKTFFDFYKLKAPSIPLLNPEFDNPQFLRLFCKTLVNLGQSEVPRGLPGLTAVFDGFLDSVNHKLASLVMLDFDEKDRLVHRAVDNLVQRMASGWTDWVHRPEAKNAVNAVLPNRNESSSLFRHLVNEGIIYEDIAYSFESNNSVEVVRFAFERFTDHLVAKAVIAGYADASQLAAAFAPGITLPVAVRNGRAPLLKPGLLEALSIQVPERFGEELVNLVPAIAEEWAGSEAFFNSLLWRDTNTFTKGTLDAANLLVRHRSDFGLLRRLLLLSASPGHPWNAEFLHRNLMRRKMTKRDATWSIFVFNECGERGPVDRLIEWAWSEEDKSHLDDESIELAAIAISWFLTTSHRYARDRSTKALVCLLRNRLPIVARLIHRFQIIDDAYVLERLFAVAYGCAMQSSDAKGVQSVAEATFEVVFSTRKAIPHILLRDYARGVVEVAIQLGCKLSFDPQLARPPYRSEWAEPTFKEGELESWEKWWENMPSAEWACVHLHHSVMKDEDFSRYIIETNCNEWSSERLSARKPRKKRTYDPPEWKGFNSELAKRWIMRRVIDLGWTTELFGEFDRRVMEGRSDRAAHKAERIGKKYQWIAYHEFLARVSDNFQLVRDPWVQKNEAYDGPWQIGFIRDIDPSCRIAQTETDSDASCWWQPADHNDWKEESSDRDWVKRTNDLLDPRVSIQVADERGTPWLALESHFSFNQPAEEPDTESRYPRRHMWYQVRSYLVRKRNLKKFFRWATAKDFMGRWMPETSDSLTLFLGEFFRSPAFEYFQQPYYGRDGRWSSKSGRGNVTLPAAVAITTDGYFHERGYDCSIEDTINLMLPSKIIVDGLDLRWNTKPGEYIDDSGLVVQYPAAYSPGPHAVLVRKDALLRFLDAQGLGIVWTVLGEKLTGVPGGRKAGDCR